MNMCRKGDGNMYMFLRNHLYWCEVALYLSYHSLNSLFLGEKILSAMAYV